MPWGSPMHLAPPAWPGMGVTGNLCKRTPLLSFILDTVLCPSNDTEKWTSCSLCGPSVTPMLKDALFSLSVCLSVCLPACLSLSLSLSLSLASLQVSQHPLDKVCEHVMQSMHNTLLMGKQSLSNVLQCYFWEELSSTSKHVPHMSMFHVLI